MEKAVDHTYTWTFDASSIVLRYFFLAGVAYFIFYQWKSRTFLALKIQQKFPLTKTVRYEIFFSILTLVIYCGTSWLVFTWEKLGITQIYLDIHEHSYYYFIVSVVLMVLVHDTYFYWTHRLLHMPGIFKWIHHTHHRSNNPTPWAAFSFHPLEAIVSVGIIPIIVFTIPCHPFAVFSFLSWMTLINVMGHLGYETFPVWMAKGRIGKWQNTSTNHNVHHQFSNCNFGLYFTFWDRVMNTYVFKQKE